MAQDVAKKQNPPKLQNRRTPKWLYVRLNTDFGPFTLDAAASKTDALCKKFYDAIANGLLQRWTKRTFCNPPFAQTTEWVRKAYEECCAGRSSLLILPVGCSQEWYRKYAVYGHIYVPDRRINFDTPEGEPTWGADRDTIFLYFTPELLVTRNQAIADQGVHWLTSQYRVSDIMPKRPRKKKADVVEKVKRVARKVTRKPLRGRGVKKARVA